MKILFTGGTGFIGRHFISHFPHNYYTVLTRQKKTDLPGQVRIIHQLDELTHEDSFDAIINLAGEPIADKRWCKKQKKSICESRWHITNQLIDFITTVKQPPEVFISGSAIGYYGHSLPDNVDEKFSDIQPDFAHKVCKTWEELAMRAQNRTRVVCLRTGVVLGRNGGALKKMTIPYKLGIGGPIGCGQQQMSWIHICDMINAIDFLLNHPHGGAFNLVAPNPTSNKAFSQSLGKALQRPSWLPVPKLSLSMLMGESASLLFESQHILPIKLLEAGFRFRFETADDALSHIYNN